MQKLCVFSKNGSFLVRITNMTILIEKEFIYSSSKKPNTTDYYRNSITSVTDVYALLEAEMDAALDYGKNYKCDSLCPWNDHKRYS